MTSAVPTSQAVILARGLGTRMKQAAAGALSSEQARAADAGQKGMMPVGRPFLDYVLSALADGGIREVTFVVAPEHEAMHHYFTATAPPARVAVRFAVQDEPRGTAHAVLAARGAVRDAPFLVLNSDNLYSPTAIRELAALGGYGLVAYESESLVRDSGLEEARVLRFALLDIGADDLLCDIREKPAADDPLALRAERWVSMNLWSFEPSFFAACERVTPSPRGELELQDAVTLAMREQRAHFRVVRRREGVLDLSSRDDVSAVAARLAGVDVRP
ncbi:MAG: nucleotidyltransferase family protein [Gemmatimonadetes bacterium]|nr:nucleotidyltransferase family protein [Gemmatimonadota bacterium]